MTRLPESEQANPSKRMSVLVGFVGALLLTTGGFFHAFRTGLYPTALASVVYVPVVWLLSVLLAFWLRRRGIRGRRAMIMLMLVWLVPAGCVFVDAYRSGTPPAMFKLFFKQPMPDSVRDFVWRGAVLMDGNYEVYFSISPNDARGLIDSHGMTPATDLDQPVCPGGDTEAALNGHIARRFTGSSLPVVRLQKPIVYLWKGGGGGWKGYMITDEKHEHVYLRLN